MATADVCATCGNNWYYEKPMPFGNRTLMIMAECDCEGARQYRVQQYQLKVKAEEERQQAEREAQAWEEEQKRLDAEARQAKCPKCGGDGFMGSDLHDYCDCQYGLRLRLLHFEAVNSLPKRYRGIRLADFDERIRETVKSVDFASGEGILIYGPVGTGKTALAVATLYHLALTGNPRQRMMFVSVPQLLAEIRAGFDKKTDADRSILRRALDADVLVLDDFGAERVTDWVQEQQYTVINHRYNKMLPIIATTNLLPAKLAAHIGDRAASRLWEMCKRVKLDGADRRTRRE